MKSILLSIKPKYLSMILNKAKTIEVRKRFPRGYVGWVYIYCTKNGHLTKCSNGIWYNSKHGKPYDSRFSYYSGYDGKVVARFWCDKVEEIKYHFGYYDMDEWTESYILENSCLGAKELDNYLQASKEYDETKVSRVYGYAINIAKVEPFDKPKEISEFKAYIGAREISVKKYSTKEIIIAYGKPLKSLTRAPQSYCFIEV